MPTPPQPHAAIHTNAGDAQRVAIGLGSNVGDRDAHIRAALVAIDSLPGTSLLIASSIIQTEPVGPIPQGPYLNACALVRTSLEPAELLAGLQRIERDRGRDRSREQRWGPRTLDLDILVFGERSVSLPGLTIPHPRLHERAFVLVPLAQIAPDLPIPGRFGSVSEALRGLRERESATPGAGSGTMHP